MPRAAARSTPSVTMPLCGLRDRSLRSLTGKPYGYRVVVTSPPSQPDASRTFRLPALAYLVVLLLLFCVAPVAFTDEGVKSPPAVVGPQSLLMLVPIVAAVFIARTATIVDATGIRVRAAFGQRRLRWDEIQGLSVGARSVYAVLADGAVRLPCVRVADLGALSRASDGHLPELADPTPKYAAQRRLRRR
jgi:hypothetical protein